MVYWNIAIYCSVFSWCMHAIYCSVFQAAFKMMRVNETAVVTHCHRGHLKLQINKIKVWWMFQLCFNLNRIHDSVGKALRTADKDRVIATLMQSRSRLHVNTIFTTRKVALYMLMNLPRYENTCCAYFVVTNYSLAEITSAVNIRKHLSHTAMVHD